MILAYETTMNERFNMIGLSEIISRTLLVILVNSRKFARIAKIKTAKIFDVANHEIKDSQNKNFCLFKIALAFCFIIKKKKKKGIFVNFVRFRYKFQRSFFSAQVSIY